MTITKPTHGAANWDTATDAAIDILNLITPNGLVSDIEEIARDAVGTALTNGSGISITVNDAGNTITVASSITQYTDEMARDALGTALVAGTGITVTVNDAGDTITITNNITQYTDEMARDALGTALVAGTDISVTVNDAGDTITIAYTGSGGGFSQSAIEEFARDAVGTALVAGTNTTITVNDAGDTITIGDTTLPAVVTTANSGTNVFAAGTGTANVWFNLPTTTCNASITNPHATKDMLVDITVGAWLITATSGVDVRLGFAISNGITAAAGPGLSNVSPPGWGLVPLNANPSASVSFGCSYSGVIPANSTVTFTGQSMFSSTTGQKQCNYPTIQITPIRYLP